MQYNYRGKYNATTVYSTKDVVSYQPTTSDPIKYYFCLTANTGNLPIVGNDSQFWGSVNTSSNFPNAVDTFLSRTSILASDKIDLLRFQELTLQTNLSIGEQDELSTLTQKLRSKLILPEDFNALQDSMSNMQSYLKDSVEGFINQKQTEMNTYADNKTSEFQAKIDKFDNKGDYVSTTTYMKNNFVRYDFQTYICLKDNVTNVVPTDDGISWRLMAQRGSKGEQGTSGIGLTFLGAYDSTVTYNPNQAVQWNGSVYYCTQTVVGEVPQDSGVSWKLFVAKGGTIPVVSTFPSSPVDKMIIIHSTDNKMKYYDSATSQWVIVNANQATALSDGTLVISPSDIGDKTTLNTTDKSSLVNAINEKYKKPTGGIPETDLASSVQTSLGKADTALQSLPSATTAQAGIVQLSDSTTSNSTTQAPTANSVKTVNERVNSLEVLYWMGGI